jgi:multiple sugar transport system permease protein
MFRTQYGSEYGQMMAVATLMVIPIIVLFFFAQKTFIQGIKTSGMKM